MNYCFIEVKYFTIPSPFFFKLRTYQSGEDHSRNGTIQGYYVACKNTNDQNDKAHNHVAAVEVG